MFNPNSFISPLLFFLIPLSSGLNISDIDDIREAFSDFENRRGPSSTAGLLRKVSPNRHGVFATDLLTLSQAHISVTDDAIMTMLCDANVDGNYHNPFDCNQFIMCASGSVYLWQCPASGSYDPVADMCVYKRSPSEQCPWRSIWLGDVKCSTIGQRPWWSPLTIPVEPDTRCGSKVKYCFRYEEIGNGECQPGYGYCKAYNACLPRAACLALDSWFRI